MLWNSSLLKNTVVATTLSWALSSFAVLLVGCSGGPLHQSHFERLRLEKDLIATNDEFTLQLFPQDVMQGPFPSEFAAKKPDNSLRVFILGSGVIGGWPDPAFSVWRMLQLMLQDMYPKIAIEFINTAKSPYHAEAARRIGLEALDLEPDLLIVCVGNDDVIATLGQAPDDGDASTGEVRTVFDMLRQSQARHDDPRLDVVYRGFESSLGELVHTAERSACPIVLCTVPSNVRDLAPLASEHRPDLTADQLVTWEQHFADAQQQKAQGEFSQAIGKAELAAEIDDSYAGLQFVMAQCLEAMAQYEQAQEHYRRARDYDTYRVRCDSTINGLIRSISEEAGEARLVDAVELLSEGSPVGVPPGRLFYDHSHLSFEGNWQFAAALYPVVCETLKLPGQGGLPLPLDECRQRLGYTAYDEERHLFTVADLLGAAGDFMANEELGMVYGALIDRINRLRQETTYATLEESLAAYEYRKRVNMFGYAEHIDLIELLVRMGNRDAALAEAWTLRRAYPRVNETRRIVASVLMARGEFVEAAPLLRSYLDNRPHHTIVYRDYIEALEKSGAYEEASMACGDFEQYLRPWPELKPVMAVVQGNLASEMGNPGQAKTQFLRAISLEPNRTASFISLNDLLEEHATLDERIAQWHALSVEYPEAAYPCYAYGKALAERGDLAEGVSALERACALDPRAATPRKALGLTLRRLGRLEPALEYLEGYAADFPDDEEVTAAIAELKSHPILGEPAGASQ